MSFVGAKFFVAVSFVAFIGLLFYLKFPSAIVAFLDRRKNEINTQLQEARRIRQEAKELLEESQKIAAETKKHISLLLHRAQEDAKAILEGASREVDLFFESRSLQAELKISQMEAQAEADIREALTDAAIDIARSSIQLELQDQRDDILIADEITSLSKRLH